MIQLPRHSFEGDLLFVGQRLSFVSLLKRENKTWIYSTENSSQCIVEGTLYSEANDWGFVGQQKCDLGEGSHNHS